MFAFLVIKNCIDDFAATEHTYVTCSAGDDCHCQWRFLYFRKSMHQL